MNSKNMNEHNEEQQKPPAKKVSIVTLKMVREASILYSERKITHPNDAANLISEFLAESDREKMIRYMLGHKVPADFNKYMQYR